MREMTYMREVANYSYSEDDFDAVTRSFRSKVYRFILASIREPDVAETLTQDCFMKAFLARSNFRSDCRIETWLLQIAINLVRDYARSPRSQFWKRTKYEGTIEDFANIVPANQCSPEHQVSLTETVQAVRRAADNLPDRQRTVFQLRFFDDMDLLEIAAATGMKEGTVKVHLFRAVNAIRQRLTV